VECDSVGGHLGVMKVRNMPFHIFLVVFAVFFFCISSLQNLSELFVYVKLRLSETNHQPTVDIIKVRLKSRAQSTQLGSW